MGEPLRILAVTNLWPYEGDPSHGAFVASQVRSLEELGVRVDVLFVNGRERTSAYVGGALRMLALNLRRRRYDLVHAHTGHCGVLARLQWRSPVLLSYVGYDLYGKVKADGRATRRSRVEARLFRRLAHVVDATITKSAAMERLLPPSVRARNTVLPNGVDRRVFRELRREDACAALGWTADEVTVLFAGRSDFARKRADLAREACELASRRIPGLRFRICERLRHDAVPTWMSAADALLLPSLAEGSPNVVKEALACNLPVVATDVGDVAELLEGVSPSRVLRRDASAEEIAEALVAVLKEGPLRSNGRERTAHLGAEVVGARLLALYHAVARPSRAETSRGREGDLASS